MNRGTWKVTPLLLPCRVYAKPEKGLKNEKPNRESKKTRLSSLRSQKRFGGAVAGDNHGGERVKKRRKKGGAAALPVVSRVEVEEVGGDQKQTVNDSHKIPFY